MVVPGQKGKSSPENSSGDVPATKFTPPPEPLWKRAGFRSTEEANNAFWKKLSVVPLCSSALRELDRRNSLARRVIYTASSPGPTTRSATRNATSVDRVVLVDRALQLKNFARRGGPDLRTLRGYRDSSRIPFTIPMGHKPYRTPCDSTASIEKSGRTSAYNPAFEQNLIEHGVYPSGYESTENQQFVLPENWRDIQQRMSRPRTSLSTSHFSERAFNEYKRQVDRAIDEAAIVANALPTLQGANKLPSAMKRRFQNLIPLTNGVLVDAQPDHYVGARPEQLDTAVQQKLSSYIVPSTNSRAPILPNNFTEAKGPSGTRAVLKRQTCHDGAIGARAMHSLQSYRQTKPIYDKNAYTISSSFDGEQLTMYTTHPTAPARPGDRPSYHMNQLKAWSMTSDLDTFRQGATAYRNMRDWTQEMRDNFIDAANRREGGGENLLRYDAFGFH
ncbi:MAG: hypothetical protein Q9227_000467 [Pyrenula ochraceoflavens]